MIGPANGRNQLTLPGDPDTDSGSLFHFPQHPRIGHFKCGASLPRPAYLVTMGVATSQLRRRYR